MNIHLLEVAAIVGGIGVFGLLVFKFTGEGSSSNVDPQSLTFVSTSKGKQFSGDKFTVVSLLIAISYTAMSLLILLLDH